MVSLQARRAQVDLARERGLSLRRACGLIGMSRSTPSYKPRLPAKDAPVIETMKELSAHTRATAIGASTCSCAARATS
jgi:putative transposase